MPAPTLQEALIAVGKALIYLQPNISFDKVTEEIAWLSKYNWRDKEGYIIWSRLPFGHELRSRLSEAQNHRCCWCQGDMVEWHVNTRLRPTFEHIIPLFDGGADNLDNIAISHAACNDSRHRKLSHEFKARDLVSRHRRLSVHSRYTIPTEYMGM